MKLRKKKVEVQLSRRHDDRGPARRSYRGRDRDDAEFFSFGTNDLTQTALGMSRDDSGSFLPHYTELEIVKRNPFATIDQNGVGELMRNRRRERPQVATENQARHSAANTAAIPTA